jgi:hypothetical protein
MGSFQTFPIIGEAASGGTTAFSALTSGTNISANMQVGSGAQIAPVNAGIVDANVIFDAINVVSEFGADPTGATSSVAAITAAIAAASAGGSSEKAAVYFPAGIYLIDSTISLTSANSNVKLFGATPVTSDATNAAVLKASFAGPMFSNFGNTGLEAFVFENLAFNGNNIATSGLFFDDTVYGEVRGCQFISFVGTVSSSITSVSITSNVVTLTVGNAFVAGNIVIPYGLTTATFLNGQNLLVATASGSQITANFTHANYGPTADTGNVILPGACITGGGNYYTKIHDNIFHGSPNCFSIDMQYNYGSVPAVGIADGWVTRNSDYTGYFMRISGDLYVHYNDFEGSPLVGCQACINFSDYTSGAPSQNKNSACFNYFELSTAGAHPTTTRQGILFSFEVEQGVAVDNSMYGGTTVAGVSRTAIACSTEALGLHISGNSIRDWDTGVALGTVGTGVGSFLIVGNYIESATVATQISGTVTNALTSVASLDAGQFYFSDRFNVGYRSLNLFTANLRTSDTTIDLRFANHFYANLGSPVTLTGATNVQIGAFFWVHALTANLTLTNGTSAFNLASGANYTLAAGQTLQFVVAGDGKIYEVGTSTLTIPVRVASSLLTAQAAAITATTVYAVPAGKAGFYRVNYVATVTTAGVTATLGGTNGFQVIYTNANGDTVVKTTDPANPVTGSGTSTGSAIDGSLLVYCGASTNLQYKFDYSSPSGSMAYDLAILVEYVGS